MSRVLLIGAGGHARSCIDVIESIKDYEVGGLVDNKLKGQEVLGYPIVGTDSDLRVLREKFDLAFISLGQIKSSEPRKDLFKLLKKLNYKLPKLISPHSYISEYSMLSEGTILMHGVIVNSNVNIGTNCIVNSRCLIEHDCKIGHNCHLSTGSIINGGVSIGDGTFVGSGSVIKNDIKIGKDCVVGAGLFIKEDLKEGSFIK